MKTLVATPDPVCPWQRYMPIWVMMLLIERYGSVRIESFATHRVLREDDPNSAYIQVGHIRNGDIIYDRFRVSTKDWYEPTETERTENLEHIRAAQQIAMDGYRRRAEMAEWKLANGIV